MADLTDFPFSPLSPAWPMSWASDWMQFWMRAAQGFQALPGGLAPESLNQPILPGWTFGNSVVINETNSSSPETERRIVAQQSYGRQLGRVLDALAVLIAAAPPELRHDPALRDLLVLRDRVEAIKTEALHDRVQRLAGEIAGLKRDHEDQFSGLMDQIRGLMDQIGDGGRGKPAIEGQGPGPATLTPPAPEARPG